MLWVTDLSFILFNTFWGIYSFPKEPEYTTVLLPTNNEIQWVILICLSSRFMTYTPSFILGKLSLEKKPKNLQSVS